MFRWIIILAISVCVSTGVWTFQAEVPFKAGKLPPAEVAALQQGLTLRFYAHAHGKMSLDARHVRLAALHVPANEPPSPFLPAGPFAAKFSGYIKNPLKSAFAFRLAGAGSIVLKINGKPVLNFPNDKDKSAEVVLAKNYNRIEIDYRSPMKGDATMRLYWAGDKFGFEPVPPDVIFSRKDEADLVEKTAVREGRLLFADHHCSSCHALPGKLARADCKMPELQSHPPQLDQAGHRFQVDWLVAWIMNPRRLRPEATMPNVLTGPDAEKDAADIAAYLGSLKNAGAPQSLGKGSQAADSEALFKKLGCSSCHRLSNPTEQDELNRLSLYFVAAKYAPKALAHFLKEPHKRYAWTRMPDFHLTDAEAGHLEAYLRDQAKGRFTQKPPGNSQRGEKRFREACLNCHQVDPAPANVPVPASPIQAIDKGCLAEKDHGKAPNFSLQPAQRTALRAFLQTDGSSLIRDTPAEFSLRQVQALQCASCHRRDGAITRWHVVLEDAGKEPEKLPSLTWAGEKLKPSWTKKLLLGQSDHRARPWIKARMPAFAARAEMLAAGLSHEHGFGAHDDDRPLHDAKLAAIGEKLIPQAGGFNCINCHGIGAKAAVAPFEAPGINLVDAALRLRYEYYQRWMLEPSRVDVVMRMPVFAMDGKTTQIREVLAGDAHRQFEAIWHYMQTLPNMEK